TMTSSPGPTPSASSDIVMAVVPLVVAMPYFAPTSSAMRVSKAVVTLPSLMKLLSSTSRTSGSSAVPIWGSHHGIDFVIGAARRGTRLYNNCEINPKRRKCGNRDGDHLHADPGTSSRALRHRRELDRGRLLLLLHEGPRGALLTHCKWLQ